jgi:hypothetical protein
VPVASAAEGGAELRELARIQRELQHLLASPRADAGSLAAAARAIGCEPEQVAVYRDLGALRFVREVAREFPATRELLGPARFQAEARAFVAKTASASYTLDGYARRFPQHLLRAGAGGSRSIRGSRGTRTAAELARLERELARVRMARTRSAGPRATASERGASRTSASRSAPRLLAAPGARLRRFACDVDAALSRFERREAMRALRRRVTHVAIFRHGTRVVRVRVAPREVALLRGLLRGEALEAAVARAVTAGLTPASIRRALARWVAARLLTPEAKHG